MTKKEKTNPIVGVVVVTHGRAADAMVAAARSLIGRIPALGAVCVQIGEEQPLIVEKISQACEEVDTGSGVLLLVDVHGSTPFHAAMTMLDGTRPAEVLCGVNLPMLIKLTNIDRSQGPPVVLAEELRESGRRSIRLGSELTGKVGVEERR
jgi:PTS system mannose-specific IIA component